MHYKSGEPFYVLRVGSLWLTPWMVLKDRVKNEWDLQEGWWRLPDGSRWSDNMVYAHAAYKGKQVIREAFYPNLIDEEELELEEKILYG